MFELEDPRFWRALVPELSVSSSWTPTPVKPSTRDELVGLIDEGYFCRDDAFERGAVDAAAHAIDRLRAAGLPPVFAMVFDELWSLVLGAAESMSPALGPAPAIVPDFWVWHVDKGSGSGWSPHRDLQFPVTMVRSDGRPTVLTLWIALTDADPDNSCIYVVPQDRDPWLPDQLDRHDLPLSALPDIRALPARAGSLLGWNQYVLHWGGRSTRWAREPRVAMACYVASSDQPAIDALQRTGPLDLSLRLAAIGRAILRYHGSSIGTGLSFPPALLARCRAWCAKAAT
jgi:hypothetical protein